ncbi:MAG: hypothetical protein K2I76_04335 [Malacoplasma sp.]|nr:hypothetical protein [Malacoplasma sp.]
MKIDFKKIKRQISNRFFNPIIFRREKIQKISKKVLLNKPAINFKNLWIDGVKTDIKVMHIKNKEDLENYVAGWINMKKDEIYLCNYQIPIESFLFNSKFEIILTNIEWKIFQIFENVNPEEKKVFNFKKRNKVAYYWIAKQGFCKFNNIQINSKISTNYRYSDLNFDFSF